MNIVSITMFIKSLLKNNELLKRSNYTIFLIYLKISKYTKCYLNLNNFTIKYFYRNYGGI